MIDIHPYDAYFQITESAPGSIQHLPDSCYLHNGIEYRVTTDVQWVMELKLEEK